MAIPVIHALSAAERICAPQEDPVLLLQAALRAVEALLQKRQQRVWRRCWSPMPYGRLEREILCAEVLPPLRRALAELEAIDEQLMREEPLLQFSRLEARREALLQQLCAFGSGG